MKKNHNFREAALSLSPFGDRRCRLRTVRVIAAALAALLTLQPVVPLAASVRTAPAVRGLSSRVHSSRWSSLANSPYSPSREGLRPPALSPVGRNASGPAVHGTPPWPTESLLDSIGSLARPVTTARAAGWVRDLKSRRLPSERKAQLNLWVGEWALAHQQHPRLALWHFRQARHLTARPDRLAGLAAYDSAVALFYEGAYRDATDAFRRLLSPETGQPGYSKRNCALWLRHAGACAGYHAQRAALGIPEPPQLDPLCGAAALAAALRQLDLPSGRPTVLAACRVTGEGSTLQDLIDAGPRLGVTVRAVTADDAGLMTLPKPLVAYCEQDHFIAVTAADKSGVTYLCSDCGMWPGGEVRLTWKQWHALSPGLYATVARPNGAWDRTLAALMPDAGRTPTPGVRVASAGSLAGLGRPQAFDLIPGALPRLRRHVFQARSAPFIQCGNKPSSPSPNPFVNPPMDGGGQGPGPAGDDPVDLATGEEVFHPATDLAVYNPHGPSVSWGRVYNSLRSSGQGYYNGDTSYEDNDFGIGWSQSYNVGVYDPSGGTGSGTSLKYVFYSDGSRIAFTAASVPSAANPQVACSLPPGTGMLAEWDYDAASHASYYILTFPDRTRWVTTALNPDTLCCALAQIYSPTGQAIDFNYGAPATGCAWPLLASITDASTGTALLTILRATDGTGNVVAVGDCFGRAVYYHVGYFANVGIGSPWPQSYQQLDRVSQIVPAYTPDPPDRAVYGYQLVSNGEGAEEVNFLHTATIPSATGAGTSTVTIEYDPANSFVKRVVDANGDAQVYTMLDASGQATASPGTATRVDSTDSNGNVLFSHTAGYDNNLSATTDTDGKGQVVATPTFSDPNDPYRPSSVTSATGETTSMTWDQYGNLLTSTSPRGVVTTYTYDYSHFALGELQQVQQSCPTGTRPPTTFTYYEPSGLPHAATGPAPHGSGVTTVSSSYTYDSLGNVLTATGPGNDAAQTVTTSYDYGTSPAVGEPLTVTDSLGKSSHLTYTAMGAVETATDALGNQSSTVYNVANQPIQSVAPATGQTGTGHSSTASAYLYVGGPLMSTIACDEGGNQVREVDYRYGAEGETLGVTGSTEAVTYTYDPLYRMVSLTDGNSHSTQYYYNGAGYLNAVLYPGYAGPAPSYDATSGAWTGISGADSVRLTSYDADGRLLQRVDGKGAVTNYLYNDAAKALTDVQFPASPALNVHYGYDAYGRAQDRSDGSGAEAYTYGDAGEVTQVQTTYTGLPARSLGYTYYPDGSRQGMSTPAGNFAYHYDTDGRLTGLTNPLGETGQWNYEDNGWLDAQQAGQAVLTTYGHNALGQLTGLANATPTGTPLSSYGQMAYDALGNRKALTAAVAGSTDASGQTAYHYDGLDRLTQEQSARAGGYTRGYSADGAGNLTAFGGQTHAFNADNQDTGDAYDGDGNPTTYHGATFGFDAADRAISLGGALTCGYTADGLRAWKQGATGGKTYFLYDGGSPVCEMDGTGAVTAVNTWGGHGLLSRHTTAGSGSSVFYAFDPQGSAAERIDGGGTVLSEAFFDAYGNPVGTASLAAAGADPYGGFGGQWGYYRDAETGLSLLSHRFYDCGTGRFINRDPLGYAGGLDLYAYCGGNPINEIDPTGFNGTGGDGHHWIPNANDNAPNNWINKIGDPIADWLIDNGYTTDPWNNVKNYFKQTSDLANQLSGPGGANNGDIPMGVNASGPFILYRGGSNTPEALTPKPKDLDGLSTFTDAEKAIGNGNKAQIIDPSRLESFDIVKTGSAGHYSLVPKDPALMQEWISSRGNYTHSLTQEILDAIVDVVRVVK